MVVIAMTWSASVAWRIPRKKPSAMMESRVPIYRSAAAAARERRPWRSRHSRLSVIPPPLLSDRLKTSLPRAPFGCAKLQGLPGRNLLEMRVVRRKAPPIVMKEQQFIHFESYIESGSMIFLIRVLHRTSSPVAARPPCVGPDFGPPSLRFSIFKFLLSDFPFLLFLATYPLHTARIPPYT